MFVLRFRSNRSTWTGKLICPRSFNKYIRKSWEGENSVTANGFIQVTSRPAFLAVLFSFPEVQDYTWSGAVDRFLSMFLPRCTPSWNNTGSCVVLNQGQSQEYTSSFTLINVIMTQDGNTSIYLYSLNLRIGRSNTRRLRLNDSASDCSLPNQQ